MTFHLFKRRREVDGELGLSYFIIPSTANFRDFHPSRRTRGPSAFRCSLSHPVPNSAHPRLREPVEHIPPPSRVPWTFGQARLIYITFAIAPPEPSRLTSCAVVPKGFAPALATGGFLLHILSLFHVLLTRTLPICWNIIKSDVQRERARQEARGLSG